MTIVDKTPLRGARLRASASRAFGWWFDELRGCGEDLRRAMATRGRRGVTIIAGERYWLLRNGHQPIGQVDIQAADPAGLLRAIPPNRRRRVVVEIPPERTLARIVTLPGGAKGEFRRILSFEIGRLFPFPAERVYFQHRIVGERDGAGSIAVEIVAVPREIVDDIRAVLAAAGLSPAAVTLAANSDAKPLVLPTASFAAPRQIKLPTRILAVAVGVAALAAFLSWPLAQQAQLSLTDRQLAALQPHAEAILRARDAALRANERTAAILALQSGRPPLVAALDLLSRAVPDGSWLLSLSISGREVVLDGLSPSAAKMALTLENSRAVTGIVFRSPISREASGLEHFQFGATLGEATP